MNPFSEERDELVKAGIIGVEMDITWEEMTVGPEIDTLTKEFQKPCKVHKTRGPEDAFTLQLLSSAPHPLGLYCFCHGHIPEKDRTKLSLFRIFLQRKPTMDPPEEVLLTSSRLGGYPAGLAPLFTHLPKQAVQCEVEMTVYLPDESNWRSKIPQRDVGEQFAPLKLVSEGIHLQGEGESRVTLDVTLRSFAVQQKMLLEPSENCVELAFQSLFRVMSPLIERHDPKPPTADKPTEGAT